MYRKLPIALIIPSVIVISSCQKETLQQDWVQNADQLLLQQGFKKSKITSQMSKRALIIRSMSELKTYLDKTKGIDSIQVTIESSDSTGMTKPSVNSNSKSKSLVHNSLMTVGTTTIESSTEEKADPRVIIPYPIAHRYCNFEGLKNRGYPSLYTYTVDYKKMEVLNSSLSYSGSNFGNFEYSHAGGGVESIGNVKIFGSGTEIVSVGVYTYSKNYSVSFSTAGLKSYIKLSSLD